MKNLLLILTLIGLVSCVKITKNGPYETIGKIVYRYHEDAKDEWSYHYGYNPFTGKFQFHYGNQTVPEKNLVTYIFFNDTITTDNEYLYNKETNDVIITFFEVHHDYTFFKNKIIKIE